jgi:hypothetical protein
MIVIEDRNKHAAKPEFNSIISTFPFSVSLIDLNLSLIIKVNNIAYAAKIKATIAGTTFKPTSIKCFN